ncbi:MAG: hypothetical protein P1S46_04625 [bacterium]|nr:hypothetical protein [bacterium]MDT8395928.1 hypothetical protein [bacterium]
MSSVIIYPDPSPDLGFILVDAEGRRSGWDPVKGIRLREIPGSNVLNESVEDPQPWYVLYLKKPDSGRYRLEITGQRDFPFSLEIEFKGSGRKMLTKTVEGFMFAGMNYSYLLSFDKTNVENSAVLPATYQFRGFRNIQPDGGYSTNRATGEISICFVLTRQNDEPAHDVHARLQLQRMVVDKPAGNPLDAQSGSMQYRENLFQYHPDKGQYTYLMDISDLEEGTWEINVLLDDGSKHSTQLRVE